MFDDKTAFKNFLLGEGVLTDFLRELRNHLGADWDLDRYWHEKNEVQAINRLAVAFPFATTENGNKFWVKLNTEWQKQMDAMLPPHTQIELSPLEAQFFGFLDEHNLTSAFGLELERNQDYKGRPASTHREKILAFIRNPEMRPFMEIWLKAGISWEKSKRGLAFWHKKHNAWLRRIVKFLPDDITRKQKK